MNQQGRGCPERAVYYLGFAFWNMAPVMVRRVNSCATSLKNNYLKTVKPGSTRTLQGYTKGQINGFLLPLEE